MEETFESLYEKPSQTHLTEKLVNGTKEELKRLVLQAQNDERVYQNLYTPIKNTNYKYLASNEYILGGSLYQIMEYIINNEIGTSYFIENKENKIIAFISYLEDEKDPSVIRSVKIFSFYIKNDKDDSIEDKDGDILADTLKLMDNLVSKYKEVNFSASTYNERAVRSYDIYFKKHNGNPDNRVQNGNEINWKLVK